MIVAATGHRPNKLGGYSEEVKSQLLHLARTYINRTRPEITQAISGMALGWDQAWAKAALRCGVPLICAIPCEGQASPWSAEQQSDYYDILHLAKEVVYVNKGTYAGWKMQARNEWMVERCDRLVALWDGSKGGTSNCISYAGNARRVDNLWIEWQTKRQQPRNFFD